MWIIQITCNVNTLVSFRDAGRQLFFFFFFLHFDNNRIQIRKWYWSWHLTVGKKVNWHISQNVKLFISQNYQLLWFRVFFFFSLLTLFISSQTIMWMQPPKAGPARTSSDPPDCPPTHLSHIPSQSLTTTHTPAPPRVGSFWMASCILFLFAAGPSTDI